MPGKLVAIDPDRPSASTLAEAADVLRSGRLVAFPTETFYGLGAAALDAVAVRAVFALKGRPETRALLVLVDGVAMAESIAELPYHARPLIARHWPGALTLVFRARPLVPVEVTAGTGTVAVRWSSHPVARALPTVLGAPITAPSANPTGAPPPTSARAVLRAFPEGIDLVLDAGETAGGLPSTLLDVTVDPPRVLRAGAVKL